MVGHRTNKTKVDTDAGSCADGHSEHRSPRPDVEGRGDGTYRGSAKCAVRPICDDRIFSQQFTSVVACGASQKPSLDDRTRRLSLLVDNDTKPGTVDATRKITRPVE